MDIISVEMEPKTTDECRGRTRTETIFKCVRLGEMASHAARGRTATLKHTLTEGCGRQEGETASKMRGELLCCFLRLKRSIRPKTKSQPITFITAT